MSREVVVDPFGYRSGALKKIGLIVLPVEGQNASGEVPEPGGVFQLRTAGDGGLVLEGELRRWRDGAVDEMSGDRVWVADFSSVNDPGLYYLYDPLTDRRSSIFPIAGHAYTDLLRIATRALYFQRCSTEIPEDFGGPWNHAPAHMQDAEAQLRIGTESSEETRDASGGWYASGGYHKDATQAARAAWLLLAAYQANPHAFTDDLNIPESGNEIPDLLDEVKWELDWLLKMQGADGAVFNRVAGADAMAPLGDPSQDVQTRYYAPATSWATASFAAVAARAARVYAGFEETMPGYSGQLQEASRRAWSWLEANPEITPAGGLDGAEMAAPNSPVDANADRRARLWASAELFAATAEDPYRAWFESNYLRTDLLNDQEEYPFDAEGAPRTALPDRAEDAVRAFVAYAQSPEANPEVRARIMEPLRNYASGVMVPEADSESDPYRAFLRPEQYALGSNALKAASANLALMAAALLDSPELTPRYRSVAEEYLHYLHGRNPLNFVMLSNMGEKGAAYPEATSPLEIWHNWFADGTPFDGPESEFGPVPGLLVGGPNQDFATTDFLLTLTPPAGQPAMKAYRDWNTGWNEKAQESEDSWKITEPSISYQAAYLFLLSMFQEEEPAPPRGEEGEQALKAGRASPGSRTKPRYSIPGQR